MAHKTRLSLWNPSISNQTTPSKGHLSNQTNLKTDTNLLELTPPQKKERNAVSPEKERNNKKRKTNKYSNEQKTEKKKQRGQKKNTTTRKPPACKRGALAGSTAACVLPSRRRAGACTRPAAWKRATSCFRKSGICLLRVVQFAEALENKCCFVVSIIIYIYILLIYIYIYVLIYIILYRKNMSSSDRLTFKPSRDVSS